MSSDTQNLIPKPLRRRYTYLYKMGSGPNSDVIAAKRNKDGLKVAIKTFPLKKVLNWVLDDSTLVPMEIHILKNVKHKNIVGYVEHTQLGNHFILVTELFGSSWTTTGGDSNQAGNETECCDLYEYIIRYTMCEKEVKSIFKQVAKAIRHLHKMGFCHGDIKIEVR